MPFLESHLNTKELLKDLPKRKGEVKPLSMIRNQTIKRQEMRYQSTKVLKTIHNLGITSIISSHLGTLNLLLGTLLHPPKSMTFPTCFQPSKEPTSFPLRMKVWVWPSFKAMNFSQKTTLGWFFLGVDLPPLLPLKGETKYHHDGDVVWVFESYLW